MDRCCSATTGLRGQARRWPRPRSSSPPAPAVVLTIWQPAAVLLAQAGGLAGATSTTRSSSTVSRRSWPKTLLEEGVQRARAHGYDASTRVEEATEGAGRRIIEIADELDARLIVCGRRGRGRSPRRCSAASRTSYSPTPVARS